MPGLSPGSEPLDANPFYIMAPVIAIVIMTLGFYLDGEHLWGIPFSIVVLFFILIFLLIIDYKKKQKKDDFKIKSEY